MVSNVELKDTLRFNELGIVVNDNFTNVYVLEKLLDSEYDYIYGYYDNELLVGFIHVTKLYETMDIVNVVVDALYRNKGIATKLIDYAMCSFSDLKSIMLEVNKHNLAAISLYKKNGFEVISERKNYYGSDTALIMKRVV